MMLEFLTWGLIILIILLFLGLSIWSNMLRDTIDKDAFLAAAKLLPKYAKATSADNIPRPFSLSRFQFAAWTTIIACTYCYLVFHACATVSLIPFSVTVLALMGISIGTTTVAGAIDSSQDSPDRHQNMSPSQGFITDILSDANGISIHRFQNVVWTVIAIAEFISKIPAAGCSFPELDHTLLALTGISSGAYVALKANENK